MQVSIVIVNYNVEYFLEQCLLSVITACQGLEVEVFMVDNASVDGSVAMVRKKFPSVKVIANQDNVGFSKANNQAMELATGKYILLLNPDTVIEEDTLKRCIEFMDQRPEAGGLGVKMVDGKGIYLPESKRGLPTPETSFYKITGINRIFPKSKRINKYYLGHLNASKTQEIEILSGAYMWMRKEALDKVGLLDESFFMYGEDIDLSYRIILGGYKNYYLPDTSIIHYKGESTKKGSLNYVFVFYNAMVIFAEKHFSSKNAKIYSKLINVAIWLRAAWALLIGFIKRITLPAIDCIILGGSFFYALQWYGKWQDKSYDTALVTAVLGALSILYVLSIWLNGGYKKPWRKWILFRSIIIGFLVALGLYSVMPDTMRFSRALILLSPIIALVYVFLCRGALNLVSKTRYPFRTDRQLKFGIIGSKDEYLRVKELISQTRTIESEYIHFDSELSEDKIKKIDDLIKVYGLNEVVFCAADLTSSRIISLMSLSSNKAVDFKIAPPESLYVIGSNSIDKKGDLFILDVNSITKSDNKKKKRTFDIISTILLLVLSPLTVWFSKSPAGYFSKLIRVISGKLTLIGFAGHPETHADLPPIKPGVIPVADQRLNADIQNKMNMLYARDYKWRTDLITLLKNFKKLGE
ncbi:MAG: glycosyltransferase family 2 protein [Flavobacteriales bacterium]